VLIANVVWMRDKRRGWKGLDTAFLRDQLHAATGIGRMAAARTAVELGYAIVPDAGRSGRLGGWQIAGFPDDALAVHATRSAQIDDIAGPNASYRERNAAARTQRAAKTHEPVEDLVRGWRAELTDAGYPPEQLIAGIDEAARRRPQMSDRLDDETLAQILDDVLGPDGRLSEEKVFDRADVIVAVAPHLHGLPVSELDAAVTAAIADERCIPLLGVAGARTQVYATASVLAAEAHIATMAEELAVQPAAGVDPEAARLAVAVVEERLGALMTAGQREAAQGLLTSGVGLDLVVGVAGSGKTTALAAVCLGFKTAGYEVIGTATSGQAARGLGEGAGIAESRTLASLCWRLEHDRIVLTDRHVIVIDETSMTEDVDLGRILAAARTAKAKVIAVGDDRQLGAVGPGGGLAALMIRHPERMWRLSENVRQVDPAERGALAELRNGDVERAVAWYAGNGRVWNGPTSDKLISFMVARWAEDRASGREALLLAWRRANVDELNRQARQAWAQQGRLSGPEIEAPGGRRYAAGDRIVTLAPGPKGVWVTSERATVVSVNIRDGSLQAVTADGRTLVLDRDATAVERLAHGYAITAHRSQGSTVDVAHFLEDGGGRQLAYVAMSRAREASNVYVASPAPYEAVERLGWAWGVEHRETWATDRGHPEEPPVAELAELQNEHLRLTRLIPPEVFREIAALRRDLADLDRSWQILHAGTGHWTGTPVGLAGEALTRAQAEHAWAVERADDMILEYRDHRRAVRAEHRARRAVAAAQRRWDRDGRPEADQIIQRRQPIADRLHTVEAADQARKRWLDQHPDIVDRLETLDRQIDVASERRRQEQQQHDLGWGRTQSGGPDIGL
jgi:hypothetical protein